MTRIILDPPTAEHSRVIGWREDGRYVGGFNGVNDARDAGASIVRVRTRMKPILYRLRGETLTGIHPSSVQYRGKA